MTAVSLKDQTAVMHHNAWHVSYPICTMYVHQHVCLHICIRKTKVWTWTRVLVQGIRAQFFCFWKKEMVPWKDHFWKWSSGKNDLPETKSYNAAKTVPEIKKRYVYKWQDIMKNNLKMHVTQNIPRKIAQQKQLLIGLNYTIISNFFSE